MQDGDGQKHVFKPEPNPVHYRYPSESIQGGHASSEADVFQIICHLK